MKQFKKTISFLLLFVYLSAIFVQNVAIGTEIGGESPSIEDFIGVQVSKNQLTDGETQKFTVALTGYEVPIYGVSVEVAYGEGFNLITTFALDDIGNNVWEVDYQYSLMNYSGMYKIVKVNVDTSEGRTEIFDLTSEFGEKKADFSNAVYEVMNTYGGINPIKSIKIEDVTYSPGEIISLTVEVDESNYQIETLDIYFLKDGENFNFPMKKTDVGVFSGEFHVESFSDNGTYTLDRLILVSNNQAIYVTNKPIGVNEIIMDLSPYKFTIEGGVVDSTAPQFISAVIPEIVYPGTPSVIEYEVTEEGSGLKDIVFQFEDSDGHTLTTYSDIAIDGTKLVLLEPHILNYSGIYKLKEVSLLDFAGNKVVVNDRSDEQPDNNEKIVYMDLSSYTLELQGTMGGIVPELVLGKSSDLVTNNQSISFSLSITNAPISFSNAMFKVRNVDTNQERWFTLEGQGDNFFDLNLSLDESLQSGQYKVERIDFYKDGLSYFIYDEDVENSEGYPRKNLDAWNFAVQNDFIGYNPSFTVVPILDPLGSQDEIFIQVKPDSFDTEFKDMNIVLVNTEDTTIRIPLVLHFNPNTGYFEARSNIYLDTISGNYNVYEITYNFLNGYDRVVNELYASELEKSQSFPSNILTIEGTLPSTGDIIKLEVIDGKESYGPEEHIRFDVNSLVSNSSIKHVNLFYENEEGRKLSVYGHNTMDGFRIEHRVNPYTSSGRYKLKNVWVEFTNGNVSIGDINQNEENYSRTQDFSHMDLTIAGTISDTVAPVLNKLTLSGSVLKFGEDMPIMIDIEENVSGVSYIQFQYKKDDSEDRAWVQVNKNEQTGQYFMTTSADTKSGDYTLMEIMISDNAGNYSIYYNKDHYSDEVNGELRDFSDFGLQIESFGGFDPDYQIKNHPNSYTMNDIVNIEVELLNETYKLDTIEVLFSNNQTVVLINDGNNRFIGEYLIKPDETNGIVEMKRLIFRSKSQYVLEIGDVSDNVNGPGWNYEDLSEGDFTVEGTLNGITPEITVSTNKSSVSRDEYVKVSIKVTDTRFKPESIGAVISVTNAQGINGGVSDSNFQYDSKSESYVMEYHVYNDWVAGDYQLTSVSFKVGDSWFSSEYEIPLFTVQGTLGGYQPDVSAAVNMKSATVGDEIVLTFRVDESTVNFSGGEVWVQIRSSYGDSTSSRYAEIIEVSPGVFQAKLPIHEYSTPGDYSVRELYLYGNDYNIRISDVSNEYAQYVEDLSAAEFEVYGTKVDLNEPKLISIIVPQNSVYVGEIFEIELNLDEESGIERGSVQLVNVDDYEKGIYLEVETVNGKVIAKSNNYDRLEAGNYRVQRVSLVDYAGNSKDYLHMDGDDWDQWTERIDFTDTVITAKYYPIEDITFKLDKETYTGRDYLELKGTLSFDIFEYMDVQFLFENELGNQVWLHGVRRPSGYYAAGTYIRPNTPVGTYTLKEAKAYKGGIPYALIHDETKNESGYKDLSGVSFTIEGTVVDWDAPILSSVRVSKTIASPNDSIMLQVFATDAASGLNFGTATYVNTVTRKTNHIYIHKYGMNELRGYWDIRNSTDPGEWVLKHIELVDESENFIIYTDESLGEVYGDENLRDFSNAKITVMGTAIDEDPPVFIGASLSKKELRNFEQFEIKINALDYVAGVERYLIFYRGDGEHETVFDGWGTSIYGMISLRDTAPDEVLLEATDLFIYDYEGNELHVTREEGRLENLDILITDTKAADVNQYVYEAYVHRGELEFGQEVDITVVPGYDTMDAKKVTLYYREIGKEPFTIVAEPFEGEFVAKFLPSNPNYKEKTEYEFMYMEIIQSNDEVVTLYTTAYPESDLIFYAESMNFSILEDTTAKLPEIIGFTTENKTVGADASIQFNLEYNASGYLPSKYEVYFRTGDTLVDSPIRINDMKNQVFYTDAFTVEGAYQVDQLVVFGPNGDALRINNSKVHSDEEIPSLDFGDLSFTVSGTLSDKAAPTVSGWSTGSKIVELGETQMFTVSALDDKTGIAYGVLYLLGPSGDISTSKPVYLYFNESTDLLEGSYKVTEETAIGQYQVAYMEVYDKAMNMTKVSNILIPEFAEQGTDLAELDFEVDGIAPDLDAPIFTSIDTVSEESVQNGVITLKVNSHDGIAENASGLKNMKFTYFADGISRTIYSDIYLENGEHYTTVRLDAIYGFEWVLRNLEIYDFAGNKTVIYHSTSNNTSSYRDLTAGNYKFEKPFITPSIESLTLDKNEVLPGEELLITLRLLTTSILPETVEAHFKSATYNQSKMTELAITPDGKHVGIDRISEFELDGEWRLEKLTAKDPYGNTYEILLKDTSFENTVYTVKDTTPDDESAELQDINISKVENNLFRRMMFSMTNLFTTTTTISEFTLGDTIRFSVNAEDAVSGVSKIKLEYTVVNQKVVIEEDLISAGGSKYTGEFTIQEFHPSGDWRLDKVTLYDKAENETILVKSETTGFVPGYSKLNFRVTGTQPDRTAPTIGGITVSSSRVLLGDKITYTVEASDEESEVKEMTLRLISVKTGVMKNVTMKKVNDTSFQGILTVTPDMPGSTWRVERITAKDTMNNEAVVTNALLGTSTLSTRRDLKVSEVTVVTEQRIEVVSPAEVSLNLGDIYKGEDLTVRLIYSEGEPKILTKDQLRIGAVDTTKIGATRVTIAYNALSTSIPVTVSEGAAASIRISKEPEMRFFEGDAYTSEGLEMEVTYENGYKRVLPVLKSSVTGYDSTQIGLQTLTVTYFGKTTEYKIEVEKIQVESIEVKNAPSKTEYIEGQEFDRTGIVVEATMNNGSKEMISSDDLRFAGFDSSIAVKNQEITVTYEGKSDTFTVNIIPKVLTEIEIATEPNQLKYVEGQDLKEEGMKVNGTYNDGTKKELERSEYTVEGYNKTTIGEQTLTVKSGELEYSFTVTVVKKVVDSIKIMSGPAITKYVVGQTLVKDGLSVQATYNDGEVQTIDLEDLELTGFNSEAVAENQEITVTYEGKTDTFTVNIIPKALTEIKVQTRPSDTEYVEGQELNEEGLTVVGIYNDDSERVLEKSEYTLDGYNKNIIGEQTITVKSLEFTDTFTVTVIKKIVDSIKIISGPGKTNYVVGQTLVKDGLSVKATYNDGDVQVIEVDDLELTGFNSTAVAVNQEITVTYEGKSDTFTVNIIPKVLTEIEIATEPNQVKYVEGQDLKEEGMKVIGTYNDGTKKELERSEYTVEGYNKTIIGEQTLTVKSGELEDSFTVTVVKKVVDSIKIMSGPAITKYVVGQTLVKDGLSVQATYNDGEVQSIGLKDLELTGFNSEAVAENQEITVTYEGKTDTFTVNIIPKALTEIKVQSRPSDTEYVEGQELNEEGLTVVGIYNDDSERILEKSEYTLDGYNKNTIGEQTITVKSLEFTTTFTVTVIKKAVAEIIIEKLPAKLSYIVGQVLESEGIEVKAHYNDGEEKLIPQADLAFSGFDSVAPASKQLITVSYEGKTKSFEIDIIPRWIIALEVKTEPEMMIYVEGQKLNLLGLTLEATYNDGKKETVDHTKIISEGYDASKVGEQKINLKADEAFVEITVTVIPKAVESIRLISLPTKTIYVVGQKLDITGISVEETYNDGEKKLVKITMDHISGFDSSKAVEDKVITITYMEKAMTFTVDIIEKVLTSLTITKEPSRVLFYVGETLDLTGIEAMLLYNDLEEKTLDVLASMISGFDSSKAAQKQVITITYEGKTASFTVDVLDKKGLEEQMEDLAGSLSSEKANELKNLIDAMEDTPENKKIIEEFTSILQEVRKIEKVDLTAPAPEDKPQLTLSEETLKKLNLPEVLEDDVVAMTVTLQTKQIPENIIKDVQDKLGKKENVLLLYDMSLVKTVENEDGSISESIIENKDIRGKLTLRVPVPETMKNKKNLEIIYVSETGKIEKLKTEERTEDGIRYLYFETSHFSLYGIIAAAEEIIDENEEKPDTETEQPVETPEEENTDKETTEKPEEDKEPETETDLPKTGETGTSTFLFAGILMMAAGAFFLKKKNRRIS